MCDVMYILKTFVINKYMQPVIRMYAFKMNGKLQPLQIEKKYLT